MGWVSRASLPAAVNISPTAAGHGGFLYLVGQDTGTGVWQLYKYDPAGNSWSSLTDPPAATIPAGGTQLSYTTVIGGKLYVSALPNMLLAYDIAGDSWTDLSGSAPGGAGAQIGASTDGTLLYAVVDVDGDGLPYGWIYDPGADAWDTSSIPKVDPSVAPNGLGEVAVGVIGNTLIVIDGEFSTLDGAVARCDLGSFTWTAGASDPTPRRRFAPSVDGLDLLVCVGGLDDVNDPSTTVRAYDPVNNLWFTIADLGTARDWSAAAVAGTHIYVVAGEGDSGSTVEALPLDELNFGVTVIPLEWSGVLELHMDVTTVDTDDVDAWRIPLEWSGVLTLPPVEDPPPATDPFIERVSEIMPTPTLVNGRPSGWTATSTVREHWGRPQLIVNGLDLSRVRGKPWLPLTDNETEPFGDAEASFALPGLTMFDDPAAFGLTAFAPVTWRRKDADGVFHTIYEGELASPEPDELQGQGRVFHCVGPLYRLDLLKEPPRLLTIDRDYGDLITEAFNEKRRKYNVNIGHMASVKVGVPGVRDADFGQFLTGTVQNYLSDASHAGTDQWTVALARPRTPVLRLKDTTTVHATISHGQRGVVAKPSKDFTTGTTAVYGSGSSGHGMWMGARFPNLTQQDAPAFPLAVGHTFVAGDGQTGFADFAAFLRRGQYGTIVSDDTYLSADFDNVEQFQDRAGITVDGVVGAQTWEAAFQPGANQGSLSGAYVDTIYELNATRKRKTNAQGADAGANPGYNPTVPRVEDYIPFGDNVSKNLGRTSAKQVVNRNYPAGLTGTVTLSTDPNEKSRFDLHAGENLLLTDIAGGDVLLHITARVRDWQAGTVTLTVDEKARDMLTAAAIHQRNKDVSDLTRRAKFGRVKSKVFNDYGQWLEEDGGGGIPLMNQQAGFWNVQRITAAPKGEIERVSLAMGSGLTEHILNQAIAHTITSIPGAARGAILIFDSPVTARAITNCPGMSTPITNLADGTRPVDHNEDRLNRMGKIFAAGGPGAAMGFYPNEDPGDGSSTHLSGMFEDGGTINFGPTGHYWLWVAIWTSTSCKVGGRLFPGAPA